MKRRNTPQKKAVMELLAKTGKAMSKDDIEQGLTIKINRATIYRILNRYCEDDILHRIIADDGKQYFAIRPTKDKRLPQSHSHFKCIKCNAIECLSTPVDLTVPSGYCVTEVNCVLSGICGDCQLKLKDSLLMARPQVQSTF